MRKKDKIALFAIAVVALIAIVLLVSVINANKAPERRQVEAQLYGYRVDGRMIAQDTNGQLWEIFNTDRIGLNDTLRLDVKGYEVERVWVEVTETANSD